MFLFWVLGAFLEKVCTPTGRSQNLIIGEFQKHVETQVIPYREGQFTKLAGNQSQSLLEGIYLPPAVLNPHTNAAIWTIYTAGSIQKTQ